MAGLNDCLGIPTAGNKPPAIITLTGARGSARASTNTQVIIFAASDSSDANGGMEYYADAVFGDYVVVKRDGLYSIGFMANTNTSDTMAVLKNPSNTQLQTSISSLYGSGVTGNKSYMIAVAVCAAGAPSWVGRTARLQAGDRIFFCATQNGGTNATLVQAQIEYLGG